MKLNLDSVLNEKDAWAAAGVALPKFDIAASDTPSPHIASRITTF